MKRSSIGRIGRRKHNNLVNEAFYEDGSKAAPNRNCISAFFIVSKNKMKKGG